MLLQERVRDLCAEFFGEGSFIVLGRELVEEVAVGGGKVVCVFAVFFVMVSAVFVMVSAVSVMVSAMSVMVSAVSMIVSVPMIVVMSVIVFMSVMVFSWLEHAVRCRRAEA